LRRFYHFIIAVIMLGTLTWCTVENRLPVKVSRNLSYLYIPGRTPLRPEFLVYHSTDTLSLLRVRIIPTQLLFNQANSQGNYISLLDIRYRLYNIRRRNTHLTDSGLVHYTINLKQISGNFEGNIMLHCRKGQKYILEVVSIDQIRKTAVQNFIFIDKATPFSIQNYMLTDAETNRLIFTYVLDSTRLVNLRYRDGYPHDLFVRYFRPDTSVPPPPDLMVPPGGLGTIPDSIWKISRYDSSAISLPVRGVYQFSIDSSVSKGISLLNFGPYFPKIMTPDQLAEPLTYLLNDNEMHDLMYQPNRKLAVDDFWLKATDNVEKSRELIRIYYNRVYYANIFFTSYKEGWRTDRGMIYIIYGPPDNLIKTASKEIWTYGEDKNPNKISFVFRHIDTSFSLNVYRLGRGETAYTRWVEAIRTWRQGNVFVVKK